MLRELCLRSGVLVPPELMQSSASLVNSASLQASLRAAPSHKASSGPTYLCYDANTAACHATSGGSSLGSIKGGSPAVHA